MSELVYSIVGYCPGWGVPAATVVNATQQKVCVRCQVQQSSYLDWYNWIYWMAKYFWYV